MFDIYKKSVVKIYCKNYNIYKKSAILTESYYERSVQQNETKNNPFEVWAVLINLPWPNLIALPCYHLKLGPRARNLNEKKV